MSAASTAAPSREKSACREFGFFTGSSWRKGTKYTFLRFKSRAMFSAEPESPSFVDMAIIRGLPFLRCAFAAMVTALSVTPWASFARVLPVQGAMSSACIGSAGPSGSASAMVVTTSFPVKSISRRICSAAVPKRLSVSAAVSLMMGTRS